MGIYGFGKAFNIRYAHNQYRPMMRMGGGPRGPILGNHSYSETTNITIKNGPSGFWGFMSGLFGGLFGGGMTSGMFGGNMFGGGFGMNMGCFSPFGALNTAMAQPTAQAKSGDRLADLQKMYPDWKITSDGNGKYDAVNKDGTVHQSGNFDEMCEKLLKEKQGTDPAKDKDKVEDSNKDKVNDDDGKSRKTTNDDDGNGAGKTGKNDGNGSQGVAAHHSTRSTGSKKSTGTYSSKSPDGWYRAQKDNDTHLRGIDPKNVEKAAAQKGHSAAREIVTQQLLNSKVKNGLTSAQMNQLTAEVIKKNPSVFNSNGSFKKDANGSVALNKLDIPTQAWINKNILNKAENYNSANKTAAKTTVKGKYTTHTQSELNEAARFNGRATYQKGIYYNESKKEHFKVVNGKYQALPNVKQVNGDSWIDKTGITHKGRPDAAKSSNKNVAAQRERANSGHTHAGSRQPWL